jgi:hypothetical protein
MASSDGISTRATSSDQRSPRDKLAASWHRRLQDRGDAGLEIDPTEIVAGEGSEKHLAIRCRGDAVGADAARRIEHRHHARFGIETAIDAVLPSEPEQSVEILRRPSYAPQQIDLAV